ncbi:MAG: selenocysteine-specific translation elongation factor [Anaerolineaceae bacterium]|nr:selenocysteine-specific translation elongation factor [Anaerolineaceae bacterium]
MRVIGTAGHVDHGKSTLVKALTGINPDRLIEEQLREMTIDLGFAWLTLSDGEEIGIVDVPGHRDFIENMLAGIGGIDAAIFVIAADEGVMPQTREHLAILDLLQVENGIIALTKVDLVDDEEWLMLIEDDIRQTLEGTVLEKARIVQVSAKDGTGLDELKMALGELLSRQNRREDFGRPRLPIDRIFSIKGFGTVVTGTLLDGVLREGDEILISPLDEKGRVRGLQTHKRKEEYAVPGSRTAVNVSGIDLDQVKRGYVLSKPGQYQPTRRLDVFFRLLADASHPIQHNLEVKFFIGASEVLARVRLLGVEKLNPGEEGWLQLEINEPVVAVRGDRFIIRRPSPAETIGGGEVVDPHPKRRHKRFSKEVINLLENLQEGDPEQILFDKVKQAVDITVKELFEQSRLDEENFFVQLGNLIESKRLINLNSAPMSITSENLIIDQQRLDGSIEKLIVLTSAYHQKYPLRRGIPKEELKNKSRFPARLFEAILKQGTVKGVLKSTQTNIYLPVFEVVFSDQQKRDRDRLLKIFSKSPFTPPSRKEAVSEIGEELLNAMIETGDLYRVSNDVLFRKVDFDAMVRIVEMLVEKNGSLTVAQFRDEAETSRRYVLAFLEHLDAIGKTIRKGDTRILR